MIRQTGFALLILSLLTVLLVGYQNCAKSPRKGGSDKTDKVVNTPYLSMPSQFATLDGSVIDEFASPVPQCDPGERSCVAQAYARIFRDSEALSNMELSLCIKSPGSRRYSNAGCSNINTDSAGKIIGGKDSDHWTKNYCSLEDSLDVALFIGHLALVGDEPTAEIIIGPILELRELPTCFTK